MIEEFPRLFLLGIDVWKIQEDLRIVPLELLRDCHLETPERFLTPERPPDCTT